MTLSRLAERLLMTHAEKPGTLRYGAKALGSMFGDEDLGRLDAADQGFGGCWPCC